MSETWVINTLIGHLVVRDSGMEYIYNKISLCAPKKTMVRGF